MKLSVIVPCYNAEATLAQQLEALSSQEYDDSWELLIADNGSTDHSMMVAKKFEKAFTDFRIIQAGRSKKSAAYARNIGVRAAQGEWLAFCDADDEVAPGWIAALAKALNDHAIACGSFKFDKFNDSKSAAQLAEAWKGGLYQKSFLPGGGTGNFGVQRWVHESIGGFEESLTHSEDADYFWRLQLEGFKLYYEPEAIVQVRLGRVRPSLFSIYNRSRNRFASNYWCYKRYRAYGMLPPPSLRGSIRQWIGIIKNGACVCGQKKPSRNSWIRDLAQQTGEVIGQIQGRLFNPCKPYQPSQVAKGGSSV